MFTKTFIKKHFFELMLLDLGFIVLLFQPFFFIYFYDKINVRIRSSLELLFILFFVFAYFSMCLFIREKNDSFSKRYREYYGILGLSLLAIVRVASTTILDAQWQAISLPILLIITLLFRYYLDKNKVEKRLYLWIYRLLFILLNLFAFLIIVSHMMFY